MKKAQGELPNYTLVLKYPEQSAAAIQQRLMDDLVAAGVAGIMVSAVDPKHQTEGLDKIASQTASLHHRQRCPAVQAHRLYRQLQHRCRQAGRRA